MKKKPQITKKNLANSESWIQLLETIKSLRHPKTGCPWDLSQTHKTLRKYMLEEAYEASLVMEPFDSEQLKEELGDVLLQVVLNSQMASESGHFDIKDVVRHLTEKMIRRHPHVFQTNIKRSINASKVEEDWIKIKDQEKKRKTTVGKTAEGIFSKINLAKIVPSMRASVEIGKLSSSIDFDWKSPLQVLDVLASEIEELRSELEKNPRSRKSTEELGDVFFTLAQLCRHLKVDPEVIALEGNQKFLNRFLSVESLARKRKLDLHKASNDVLEELWQEAKKVKPSKH